MKALVVIDMQNDFITGSLGSDLTQSIVSNVVNKIKEKNYDTLYFTKDTHSCDYLNSLEGQKLPVLHCVAETEGWNLIPEIEKAIKDMDYIVIRKNTFGSPIWENLFTTYDEIEICGVCTDICTVSNALVIRMFYPDMPITVDAKCCAGTSIEAHNAALTVMKSCQIDIIE